MLLQIDGPDTQQQLLPAVSEPRPNPASARAPSINEAFRGPLVKVTDEAKAPAPRRRRRDLIGRPLAAAIGLIVLTAALAGGYIYWDYAQHVEWTDDAFVASRQFAIAPKVSGYITAVPVTDNQHIAAGEVIAQIDQRDYRVAIEQAQARVAAANASIVNIEAQITVQRAQLDASRAQVEQTQATLVFAGQQAVRYQALADRKAGPEQQAQQMNSTLHEQEAALKRVQASVAGAERLIEALQAQRASAQANLAEAQAQLDQARLNLSYTTITAAQAGSVVNLTAAIGQFAQVGTNLTIFVPDEIWVTANYKETQLALMRPGQPVIMRIDAYPGRAVHGHVASIQPGSGTVFSLLPAQNATGNYVKIVQRVPVKLIIDDPPTDVAVGPGMSVVPNVRVDPAPSLYEWLLQRP
jgi:membrane fusion protein (multidrug efflux system)